MRFELSAYSRPPPTASDRENSGSPSSVARTFPARFQTLMRDYQRALLSGRSDAELAKIEEQAAPHAPKDFKFADFKANYHADRLEGITAHVANRPVELPNDYDGVRRALDAAMPAVNAGRGR